MQYVLAPFIPLLAQSCASIMPANKKHLPVTSLSGNILRKIFSK